MAGANLLNKCAVAKGLRGSWPSLPWACYRRRPMVVRGWGALVLAVSGLACDNAEVKACHAEMQTSQQALVDMDKDDVAAVEATLALVDRTLEACKQAGRGEEVSNVADARRQVAAHLDALERRAERPARPQLSPERLAELLKTGDPECPKGQGYEPAGSKEVVKCTGKQLVELSSSKAREHFDKRGYRLSAPEPEGGFRAEFGASRYAFQYAHGADSPPSCLEVTGRPGTPWQEIVARLTGVHPDRVKQGEPVRVGGRSLPVELGGDPGQWSVKLGACQPAL